MKDSSSVAGNTTDSGLGGGIYNTGKLTLKGSSTVYGNTVTRHGSQNAQGGGIWNGKVANLEDSSSVTGNAADVGGGIYSRRILILKGSSSVTGNTATVRGGGVYRHGGVTTIRACNTWTGAISPNSPDDPPAPILISC
jgi:hypothetical protein